MSIALLAGCAVTPRDPHLAAEIRRNDELATASQAQGNFEGARIAQGRADDARAQEKRKGYGWGEAVFDVLFGAWVNSAVTRNH